MRQTARFLALIAIGTGLGLVAGWWLVGRNACKLEVTSEPTGATVFLDRNFVGVTPVALPNVSAGEHQLRLKRRGHHDSLRIISVGGHRQSLHTELDAVKGTGMLVVRSEPPGAHIWLDGEEKHQTPARIDPVSTGPHHVRIQKAGWVAHEQKVDIAEGKETLLTAKLVSDKVAFYRAAIAGSPDNISLYPELGRHYLLNNDLDRAFELLLQGAGTLARLGLAPDKGFHELFQGIREEEPDYSSPKWQRFVARMLEAIRDADAPVITVRPLRHIFVELDRWKDLADLCTASLAKGKENSVPLHIWRMHAAFRLKDWRLAASDFDEVMRATRNLAHFPRRSLVWTAVHRFDQSDFLWAGACARLWAGDEKGAREIVRTFKTGTRRDYWLNTLDGERWLKRPADGPPMQWLEAQRRERAASVDGVLAEPEWKGAGRSSKFYGRLTNTASPLRSTIFALYDDKNLYLAMDCEESDPAHVDSEVEPGDADMMNIWRDSSIELFLDADRDYSTYVQFIINSNGAQFTAKCRRELFSTFVTTDIGWDPQYGCAVRADEKGWRWELAIPFENLGVRPPKAGDAWAFNLIRCRSRTDETRAGFAPYTQDSHHQPRCSALLVFR